MNPHKNTCFIAFRRLSVSPADVSSSFLNVPLAIWKAQLPDCIVALGALSCGDKRDVMACLVEGEPEVAQRCISTWDDSCLSVLSGLAEKWKMAIEPAIKVQDEAVSSVGADVVFEAGCGDEDGWDFVHLQQEHDVVWSEDYANADLIADFLMAFFDATGASVIQALLYAQVGDSALASSLPAPFNSVFAVVQPGLDALPTHALQLVDLDSADPFSALTQANNLGQSTFTLLLASELGKAAIRKFIGFEGVNGLGLERESACLDTQIPYCPLLALAEADLWDVFENQMAFIPDTHRFSKERSHALLDCCFAKDKRALISSVLRFINAEDQASFIQGYLLKAAKKENKSHIDAQIKDLEALGFTMTNAVLNDALRGVVMSAAVLQAQKGEVAWFDAMVSRFPHLVSEFTSVPDQGSKPWLFFNAVVKQQFDLAVWFVKKGMDVSKLYGHPVNNAAYVSVNMLLKEGVDVAAARRLFEEVVRSAAKSETSKNAFGVGCGTEFRTSTFILVSRPSFEHLEFLLSQKPLDLGLGVQHAPDGTVLHTCVRRFLMAADKTEQKQWRTLAAQLVKNDPAIKGIKALSDSKAAYDLISERFSGPKNECARAEWKFLR